ncbi:MAG: PKD domain-containing protein [Bacteroidota bacterium]
MEFNILYKKFIPLFGCSLQRRNINKSFVLTLFIIFNFQFSIFNFLKAQAPVADFTSNITSGCSPITVNFFDQSSNNPTTWSWNFGNSNTSALQNPGAVYTTPGTYTVTLIAGNLSGSDTIVMTNYLTVYENPSAGFTSDVTSGCKPFTVQFTDMSDTGSAAITSWFWNFGDGGNSAVEDPIYTYISAGNSNVSLTVTDANGCESTIVMANYISVSEIPQADFTGTPNGGCTVSLTVDFSDLSIQGSAAITSWYWDFGDSLTGNVQDPSHTYTSFGSYDVTLIATDMNSCSDTLVLSSFVNIGDFTADFSWDTTASCPDLTLSFADSTFPTPDSWLWDFGDGNTSISQNPTHTYDSTGTFPITLIASNAEGCADTVVHYIYFEQPVAGFTADSMDNCELPFTVNVTNNSTGVAPLQYFWDFGDYSAVDTNQNPSHTYTAQGVYDVSLVIIDAFGCTDTLYVYSILIARPNASFTGMPVSGCIPLTVDFTDQSTNVVGNITNWYWNFGDPQSGANNTSTVQNSTHTYDSVGTYPVILIITTDRGCTDTIVNFIAAGIPPVSVDFSMSDTIACHGEPVQFTDLSTDTINYWVWQFGDGYGSSLQNPTHEFQDTGWISVTLIAGMNGCIDTTIQSIYIMVPKPIFTVIPAIGCSVPHEVTFTDASLGADTWYWDFGDGNTSTDINPVHIYMNPGVYTVKLIVTNTNGCEDSTSSYVLIPELNPGFTADDTSECFSLTVNFTDNSTFNFTPMIVGWYWDFGDSTSFNGHYPPAHTYSDTGKYDIMLVITDLYGCKDTLIKEEYVAVNGVYSNFVANILTGCVPLTVNFVDLSSGTSPVDTWFWSFGDGSPVDSSQNPSHTYTARGSYNVQLNVIDTNGCIGSRIRYNYINPTFPYPDFYYKTEVCIDEDIAVADSSTGTGLSYYWDFGDSCTDNVSNPTHAYSDSGIYSITLTVTDTNGCDSTLVQPISVVSFSTASFSVDTFITDCPPLVVTFTDSSSSDAISWFWDFGDGTTSIVQNPSHTYTYPDTFDVALVVMNSTGCKDTLFVPDLIMVGGPYGTFSFSPTSGCTPLDVTFNASVVNAVKFEWDFGDGNIDSTSGDSAIHTYLDPGYASPILIITDALGCELEATPPSPGTILIDEPVASFTVSDTILYTTLCGLDTVFFYDFSYTQHDSTTITGWFWDFGDGDTSNLINPYHIYDDDGTYAITLEIVNSIGCIVSTSDTINILVDTLNILTANILDITNISCNGDSDGSTSLTASGGTAPYNFSWDYDTTQTTSTVTGLFAGVYTVTVTDSNGCLDTAVATIIEPPPLIASIIAVTEVSCVAENDGSATLSASGGTAPYSYLWDDPSSQTTATATGLAVGGYTVTLSDSVDCDTSVSVIITIDSIHITFSAPDSICFGDSATIDAIVTGGDSSNYTYSWYNGAATSSIIVSPDSSTTYILTVNDGCVPPAIDSFTVYISSYPTIGIYTSLAAACIGDTIIFSDTIADIPGSSYLWDLGDGTKYTAISPDHQFDSIGIYNVSVTVTSPNGCVRISDCTVIISSPNADFITEPSVTTLLFSTIGFTDLSTCDTVIGDTLSEWDWDFGDDYSSTIQNPKHTYNDIGTYTVQLTIINEYGCPDSIWKTVIIDPEFRVWFQNAFTPNGDGKNDVFMIKGIGIKEFEMFVFNRWGQQVFKTTDTSIPWDGTIGGGTQIAHQDIYVYLIYITDVFGEEHEYEGTVLLIK